MQGEYNKKRGGRRQDDYETRTKEPKAAVTWARVRKIKSDFIDAW